MRTVYPKINSHPIYVPPKQFIGDAATATLDCNAEATRLGTSVSSAAWTTEDGDASVSGEALSSNVASGLITTASDGLSLIKVKLTFADGQIINQFIKVVCVDPDITDTRYPE